MSLTAEPSRADSPRHGAENARPPVKQENCRNGLVRRMDAASFAELRPHLVFAQLPTRRTLETPGVVIERVFFPESGIVSVVARTDDDRRTEIGLIGHEGVTGSSVILGGGSSPNETYVQVAGEGHLAPTETLIGLTRTAPAFHRLMLLYVQAFHVQVAQTALANSRANIDKRLARWLLMAADRTGGQDMPLTHELLALMLGVRRPGVTDALHRLEGDHLVRANRASLTIRDRGALEALAGGFYGVPEREYERLLPIHPQLGPI